MNYFAYAEDEENCKLLFNDFCKGRKVTGVKFLNDNTLRIHLNGKRHNRLIIIDAPI